MPFDPTQRMYPYVKNGRFFNFKDERKISLLTNIFSIFAEWWLSPRKQNIDLKTWYQPKIPLKNSFQPLITWIGHSTFLVQLAKINILFDPIFGKIPFFKRLLPAGVDIKNLPPIDYVLISHNHPDHFSPSNLMDINYIHRPTFLVPQGDRNWFLRRGITKVYEFNWWDQQFAIPTKSEQALNENYKKLSFTFLPAYHWSQKSLFDFNRSLWGSWLINFNGYKIYFGGDSAYENHFKVISRELGPIDVALLPIGPCEPQDLMKWSHITAEQAGQAFLDLGAENLIPMHWGTFNFGADSFESPLTRLRLWWQAQTFSQKHKLYELAAGQSVKLISTKFTSDIKIDDIGRQLEY